MSPMPKVPPTPNIMPSAEKATSLTLVRVGFDTALRWRIIDASPVSQHSTCLGSTCTYFYYYRIKQKTSLRLCITVFSQLVGGAQFQWRVPSVHFWAEFETWATSAEQYKALCRLIITPNGLAWTPQAARHGVIPRLLSEILQTRIMVKAAMKRHPSSAKASHAPCLPIPLTCSRPWGAKCRAVIMLRSFGVILNKWLPQSYSHSSLIVSYSHNKQ